MDWNACERMIQWWRRDPHFVNSYSYMEARVLTYGEDPAGAPNGTKGKLRVGKKEVLPSQLFEL